MAAKEVVVRRLKTAADIGKFMGDYYYELDEASKSAKRKIAWCTSVGPAEILRSMGFLTYFPETHSAMLGASKMAADLIPSANAIGYSPEICSYLTADIGACIQGVTPMAKAFPGIERIPRADVLVYNTNQCRDVQDWFSWHAKRLHAPLLGIETHRNVGKVTEAHVSSIAAQMENMVEPLERIAGRRLDMEELKNTVSLRPPMLGPLGEMPRGGGSGSFSPYLFRLRHAYGPGGCRQRAPGGNRCVSAAPGRIERAYRAGRRGNRGR